MPAKVCMSLGVLHTITWCFIMWWPVWCHHVLAGPVSYAKAKRKKETNKGREREGKIERQTVCEKDEDGESKRKSERIIIRKRLDGNGALPNRRL